MTLLLGGDYGPRAAGCSVRPRCFPTGRAVCLLIVYSRVPLP